MTTYSPPPASGRSTDRWENEGGRMCSPDAQSRADLQSELRRYGITPVQLTVFDWGGYRYSSSKDAIAAATRPASA
jgi:hypothetical protein